MYKSALTILFFVAFNLAASANDEDVYKGLSNFTRVLDLVERNYVDDVDAGELTESAIEGMLRDLDPYSAYLNPERYKELEIGTSGEFGGVGMEVTVDENGVLTVISPIEDTPSSRAGIKPKDQIIAIEGQSTKGMVVQEAVKLLRGPRGSSVKITIHRPGNDIPIQFTLVRDKIVVKSVKPELMDGGIGYVRLTQFQENSARDLNAALKEIEAQNGGELTGIILDLRNNPGGLLSEAIEIVDEFVDKGLIVSVKGRVQAHNRDHYATKDGQFEDEQLIVLVNDGSASASEVVAEALQDGERALILGTGTFGKGSVQTIIRLEDGAGLKLTTAKFYAPSGRSINEVGVTPDIIVEIGKDKDKDNQLDNAVNILKTSDVKSAIPKG